MPSVGTAYVNIRVSTKGFEASLDSLMKRLSTKMEAHGTKLGKDFERGLKKTNFDSAFDGLVSASDRASDKVANNINKITTESREAKDSLGDLSGELRDVANSARSVNLGSIGGGGGGRQMRSAGDDASWLGRQISEMAGKADASEAALAKLYNIAAFGGTAVAGLVGGLSAAAQGIFAVGANAAASAPALGVFASGLLGIAQIGATVGISMKGVGEALKAGFDKSAKAAAASGGATKALQSSTKSAADAARRAVEAAQRGVRDAVQGVQDAKRGVAEARRGLADAYRDAARAASDAARRTADAERALAQAQRETTAAQVALNAARAEGLEQLEDIAFAAEDAGMAEERASLALQDAFGELQAVSELAPDDRMRVEAELAYREAELNMRQAVDRREDADKAQREAAKSGVEGTEAVRSAHEDLADAHENEADAARDVADARRAEAEVAENNARRIQDAQEGIANAQRGVADAQQSLADAQRALADAQKRQNEAAKAATPAMTALAKATDVYDEALKKLSPSQKEFVKRILGMKDDFEAFSRAVAEPLFAGLLDAMDTIEGSGLVGVIQDGLVGTSEALADVARDAATVAASPAFQKSLGDAMESNNEAMRHFGGAGVNLADAFVQVADAAGPLLVDLSKWVETVTQGWANTARAKNRTGELGETMQTAANHVKEFWNLGKELWRTLRLLGGAASTAADNFGDVDRSAEDAAKKGYISTLTDSLKTFNDNLDKTDLVDRFTQALKNLNAASGAIKTVFQPFIDLGSDPQIATAFDTIAKSDAFSRLGATAGDAVPELAEIVVNLADVLATLSESGSMDIFLGAIKTATDVLQTLFNLIDKSPLAKSMLGAVAAVFALRRALRLMGGVAKFVVQATLGPLLKSLDKTFKARKFKATGGVDPSAPSKVAGAGAEAKEGTWEAEVLVHLKLIKTAIDLCCTKMTAAMGRGAAAQGLQGAAGAGAAGARAPGGVAAAGAASVSGGLGGAAAQTGKIGKFAGVMGKFSKVLGPATKLLKPLSFGLRLVGGAFRFMLGPIGMIVLTVLPLLWPLLVKLEEKTGIFSKTLDVLKKALSKVGEGFTWLWDKIKELFGWVKKNWPLLLAIITGPIGLAVLAITKNWDKIVDFAKGVPDKIKNALSGMWDSILDAFNDAWEKVKAAWWKAVEIGDEIERRLKQGLKNIWSSLVGTFRNAWKKVKEAWWKAVKISDEIERRLKRGLRKIWDVVVDKLRDAWTKVKNVWGRIVTWVKGRPGQFVRNLKTLWNVVSDKLRAAFETVKSIFIRVVNWAKQRPAALTRALSGLWDGFKDKLNTAWTRVKEIWETIKRTIGRWPAQMTEKLSGIWDGIKNGLRGAYNWAAGKVNTYLIGNINKILTKFKAPTIGKWGTFAEGGPVRGPGGPRQDRVPALLSNGEHILTAAEVRAMGGHRNVAQMRKAVLRGEKPGTGGIVGWFKDKYTDLQGALAKGAEVALKWVLSKFKGAIGDNPNIVGQIALSGMNWVADKITGFGKKKDTAAAAASGPGKAYTGPPGGWTYPLAHRYGITQYPNSGHNPSWSVDIGAPTGTAVRAASRGNATAVNLGNRSYGNYIVITHAGGQSSLYAHLSRVLKTGAVRTGQVIGYSGSTGHSTGPHLHFELRPSSSTIAAMAAHGVRLGQGGVVGASSAGTLAVLAEAGQSERVTPLDAEGFTPAERRMLEALETSLGGGGGGDTYHVHPSARMNEAHLADLVARRVAWKRRRGAGSR